MGFLKKLKEILKEMFIPESVFKEITEENLKDQKIKLDMTEYKKWIKKKIALAEIEKSTRKMKGIIIPDSWNEKIKLLEKEKKEIERF